MSKWIRAKTNPGNRHQRPRPRAKVKEQVSFHFSVPAPELWLVAYRHDPSLLCRNRDETLRGFCDPRTGFLSRTNAWKIE
jgi:hypothetical protein